jgi:hypothetical protein
MGGNLDRESTKFVEVAGLGYFDETLFSASPVAIFICLTVDRPDLAMSAFNNI